MGSKEAETTKRVAAVAEAVAASRRPSPGYPAFGILVAFVILAGVGSVLAIASNRSIFSRATSVNCTTNAALRNVVVNFLYQITAPKTAPPGSSPTQVAYTAALNKVASDYRDSQLKSLSATNCALLAAGTIKLVPLPAPPPPPSVVAIPGSAAPLPLAPLTGAMGLAGKDGAAGKNGADGKDGAPGKNGNTILNGSGPPASETGTVGDFYIDLAARTFYGPKTSAGWGEPTPLKGPMGGQGAPGSPAPPAPTPTPTPTPSPVTPTVTPEPTPSPSPCLLTVSSTAVTIGGLVCP